MCVGVRTYRHSNVICSDFGLILLKAYRSVSSSFFIADISLLSRFLYTEEEVKDEDVPWTWDYIFASVSSELRDEWAQEEGDDS